jgi:hypothetical protein
VRRRPFIGGVLAFALIPTGRTKKVMLKATIEPIIKGIPLLFTLGNQSQSVLTDQNGVASVVFRCRSAEGTVSGFIEKVYVSASTRVIC